MGELVISTSRQGRTLCVGDTGSGLQRTILFDREVRSCVATTDGSVLAVCCDGFIELFDMPALASRGKLCFNAASLCVAPNSSILYCGGAGADAGVVMEYDIATKSELRRLAARPHDILAIGYGGNRPFLMVATADNVAVYYNMPEFTQYGESHLHHLSINDVLFVPSGGILLCSSDNSISLYEMPTISPRYFIKHAGPVLGLAHCSGTDYLASASADGTVAIWDCNEYQFVRVIETGPATSVRFSLSAGSNVLYVGLEEGVVAFDFTTGVRLGVTSPHLGAISSIVVIKGSLDTHVSQMQVTELPIETA